MHKTNQKKTQNSEHLFWKYTLSVQLAANDNVKQIKVYVLFLFQKLAKILYEAADDAGYINPCLVEPILGYTQEQANTEVTVAATSVPDIVQFNRSIYRAPPSGG